MRGLTSLFPAGNILLALLLVAPCPAQKIDDQIVFTSKASSLSSHARTNGPRAKTAPASNIQGHTYGDAPFIVHATSDSPGAITYALVSGNATVTPSGLVTLTGAGSVTVEATQWETAGYTAATTTASFSVSRGTPTITFNVPNIQGTASFVVRASSTSTGAFTYSVVSGPAQIKGDVVSATGSGEVVVKASEAADANYNSASKTASFWVGAPTLTVTANDASRVYGAANPAFSGSVTGINQAEIFTETFSTPATLASAPGQYTVTPAVSGPGLSSYAVKAINGTLTITRAPTLITISTNSTTINPNQTLSLAAQVTSTTTGVPSDSVTFFDNGKAFQTVPLSNGAASLVTSLQAGATHVLTASFSGDANFLASAQSSAISIPASIQDFTFAIQGGTTELSAPGKAVFSVSPLSGRFGGPVTFSVLGLPNGATAQFTPSTLDPNAGPSVVQLVIQPNAQTAGRRETPDRPSDRGVSLSMAVLLTCVSSRKLRLRLGGRRLAILLVGLGLSGPVFLAGCGSGILQQGAGTYSLSIVATSGTIQHTQNLTLMMQ